MVYYSNLQIEIWFQNCKKQAFRTTIFSFFFLTFIAFGMYIESDMQISRKFIIGLGGILAIFIFSVYVYFRTARIINNTIQEIEVMETKIIFTTYSYKIMNVYMIYEKNIVVDFVNLNFSQIEYPLNHTKHKLERECFKIIIDDVEFYLLYKYFNDIESVIRNIK